MIITRKIEIYVAEQDSEQKKEFMHTLYQWRDLVRKAANIIVCHKFVQQNIRDFMYIQEDVMERFFTEHPERIEEQEDGTTKKKYYVSDILKTGKGMSEQNITYRILSSMLKGKVPADIFSCLNQSVSKTFKETYGDILKGAASLRSYKNNIPMPFSAKAIESLHKADDGRYYFTWFGIPFCCRLGHDRSNNAAIIDRGLSGEYKICSSSIAFEKKIDKETKKMKQRIYLYFCVNIPQSQPKLDEKKVLRTILDVEIPIMCSCTVKAKQKIDSGENMIKIGSKEEFLHRREQIQACLRRHQIAGSYCTSGKGRKKMLRLIDRFHLVESNYVNTKMHIYAKKLVQIALRNECATIFLANQEEKEEKAKIGNQTGQPFLLRNWSYHGLKEKIAYKAKRYGIKVVEEKKEQTSEED